MVLTPYRWKVVVFTDNKTQKEYTRLLTAWQDPYTVGSSYKLSNELFDTKMGTDYYMFSTMGGSMYVCYKDREGLTASTNYALKELIDEKHMEDYQVSLIHYKEQV